MAESIPADPAESHRRFLALFERRQVRFGYEQSCRMRRGRLAQDRCLVSFGRTHFGDNPAAFLASLRPLLADLDAPPASQAWLARHEAGASVVHFGFEHDRFLVHKIYLEYVRDALAALSPADGPAAPVVVHRALKWRVGADGVGETVYRLLPHRGVPLDLRLARAAETAGAAGALGRDVLALALARAAPRDLVLLDVADSDGPRRSFDLRVYDAQLRLADAAPAMRRLARSLDIADDAVDTVLQVQAPAALGHVAGGLDAAGAPFATLYYGARER